MADKKKKNKQIKKANQIKTIKKVAAPHQCDP